MYGGLPAPPMNVLAFFQTEAGPVLFHIYAGSCLSFQVRHSRDTVENKIAVYSVIT
jgi:hypothetical protein